MMEEILKDSRFAHIVRDPRFKRTPRHERKVIIDKRFQSMFKDKKFKVKYTIDKRGRPANTSSTEDLKRYYHISTSTEESDSVSDEENVKVQEKHKKVKMKTKKQCGNELPIAVNEFSKDQSDSNTDQHEEFDERNEELSDYVSLTENVKDKLHDMNIDYARGEGILLSDSSSDGGSDSEGTSDGSEDLEHNWGELDKDAETTQEPTRRIAICNMDWDRVRAQDLLVLLSSFLPKMGGAIQRVAIYPSEFGMKRMKEEEVNGPLELCDPKKTSEVLENSDEEVNEEENEDDEAEEGKHYDTEKLRCYQLNRLRYFYAVAECDSAATAEAVYTACDGLEYESSATKLDLRFVPEDMSFDQEPRDTCDRLPDPGKYAPKLFTTTALQQAKVELTWDETDPQRTDVARKLQSAKNIDDIDDADLRVYLASSGSDGDDAAEENGVSSEAELESKPGDTLSRYKLLLEEAELQERAKKKKSENVQMEVMWGLGLKEKTEKLVKERLKSGGSQATPFEQMLAKRREKKRQRREGKKNQKQLEENQQEEDDNIPFSDDEIPSDIDISDPYFKEELKDMMPKENRKKKRKHRDSDSDENEEEKQKRAELELLMLDEDAEGSKKHFSLKSIQETESDSKKKRKKLRKKIKKEEQPADAVNEFQVNVNDERFAALFTSHHYNIDPTDPHYRHTKSMEVLRTAKSERRREREEEEQGQMRLQQSHSKQKETLSQLVKSVKMKTRGLVKRS